MNIFKYKSKTKTASLATESADRQSADSQSLNSSDLRFQRSFVAAFEFEYFFSSSSSMLLHISGVLLLSWRCGSDTVDNRVVPLQSNCFRCERVDVFV